ncbi:asparaginase [Halomonas piscis]|uniref:asparaginase n=1 Tax=Halomonas piscis TaxID=3031727 RepID=UPI00289F2FD6|nr:asparaginase [Halomonas piscis]
MGNTADRRHALPVRVIYTGGTVGMLPGAGGLAPGGDFAARLEKALATLPADRRRTLPARRVHSYSRLIDSSAVTPLDWHALAEDIRAHRTGYAGVVVVHGTDTLSWTAASLALQLRAPGLPVIVTGAMQPLEASGSDALGNLEGALRFAAEPGLDGVAVYFAGRLLHGARATKEHASAADAFASPNAPALGDYRGAPRLFTSSPGMATNAAEPDDEIDNLLTRASADYERVSRGEVARIVLWPGIAAWQLSAWLEDSRVTGALLELWGAGNMADDPALRAVLERAGNRGKLMAAVSQCPRGSVAMGAYAAGQGLEQAGVLSGADMTPEAVYTKLVHLLALPLDNAARRRLFAACWAGERSEG